MAATGSMNIDLLVRVGDSDPIEMGSVRVPLRMHWNDDDRLVIDMSDPLSYVRELFRQVFADPPANGADTPAEPSDQGDNTEEQVS